MKSFNRDEFVGCQNRQNYLNTHDLVGAEFFGLNLTNLDFSNRDIYKSNFRYSNIHNSNFKSVFASNVDFEGAIITETDFSLADLEDADFYDADLDESTLLVGANIEGIDIRLCTGDGKVIKNIPSTVYDIAYTKTSLAIGCQQHKILEWQNFGDEEISSMDRGALDWWKENRDLILRLVK